MAGGIGSRFWPISREERPKQFLDLSGEGQHSFLRKTFDRCARTIPKENIIVVSLTRYKDLVMEQLPELEPGNLLLEPYNRNTAPCLAFATYTLLKRDPQAVFLATPADLRILDDGLFDMTIRNALDYATEQKALITLGIVPDRPDTNFGYIQITGGEKAYLQNRPVKVKTFTEKPDAELADIFLKSGEFLWNSGIFIWQASAIKEELEKYVPEVTKLFNGWEDALDTPQTPVFLQKVYSDMPRVSIDYGVMEKTSIAWVYPSKFGWADIGNWASLYDYLAAKDEDGNVVKVTKDLLQGSSNNIIYSSGGKKLVVVKDLDNFIVVDTKDVLMICPRDDAKLKEIISNIGLPKYENYR